MAIFGFMGGMGSGKSYTMVSFGLVEHLNGMPVYSNFPCAFSTRVTSWPELVALRRGVWMWDETHLDIDSRNFASNVGVTGWLTQIRKLDLHMMYCTQDFSQVDTRLRKLTDYLVMCFPAMQRGERATRYRVIDLNPLVMRQVADKTVIHDSSVYGLYNSKGVVLPLSGKLPPLEIAFADILV